MSFAFHYNVNILVSVHTCTVYVNTFVLQEENDKLVSEEKTKVLYTNLYM